MIHILLLVGLLGALGGDVCVAHVCRLRLCWFAFNRGAVGLRLLSGLGWCRRGSLFLVHWFVCFDGLCFGCWVTAAKRFDGRGYREVVGAVGALEEFKGICGHFCFGGWLACVAKTRDCKGWGRESLLLGCESDKRVMRLGMQQAHAAMRGVILREPACFAELSSSWQHDVHLARPTAAAKAKREHVRASSQVACSYCGALLIYIHTFDISFTRRHSN